VRESGVEAAAATAGIVGITAEPYAPLTIRADRPFLMVLTEKATSAPLFMALIRTRARSFTAPAAAPSRRRRGALPTARRP